MFKAKYTTKELKIKYPDKEKDKAEISTEVYAECEARLEAADTIRRALLKR